MKRSIKLISIIFILALVIGCGARQTDWHVYNESNAQFTGIAEQYQAYYNLQDPETQSRWKSKFDEIFKKAYMILTRWRGVLDAGEDPAEQVLAFSAIKSDIILVLFELSKDNGE